MLLNRTVEHYQLDQPVVKELTTAIEQFGGNGRVLFSGFILHELSGGHVAPLANWTHRQLVASSHVHDKWRYTNVIPDEFTKKNDSGIEEFSDLMNVSAVIAHERGWIQYYQSRPAIYTERWHFDRFYIFERRQSNPSFFYRGSGELLGFTSRDVSAKASSPEIVIKYNYFPFLRASNCTVSPEPISETITFIKLSNCPLDTPIRIYAGKP